MNGEERIYKDKDGEVIDLAVVHGIYLTKDGITRFFERQTNYSQDEIKEAVQYILKSVKPVRYGNKDALRMAHQIEGDDVPKNFRGKAPIIPLVIMGIAFFVIVYSILNAAFTDPTKEASLEVALENDRIMFVAVGSSESNYNYFNDHLLTSDELTIYGVAKQVISMHQMNEESINEIKNTANEEYADAALKYIGCCKLAAYAVEEYLNDREMKDLSDAQDLTKMALLERAVVNEKRVEYLRHQGASEEQIAERMKPIESAAS